MSEQVFYIVVLTQSVSRLTQFPMAPTKMQAVVTAGGGDLEVAQIDVPKPGPREILVKVHAAAQNPTDCMSSAILYV